MLKEPTYNPLNGPALSEEVCRLALERIKALLGWPEDASEERELIDWRRSRTPANTPSTGTTTCRCGRSRACRSISRAGSSRGTRPACGWGRQCQVKPRHATRMKSTSRMT